MPNVINLSNCCSANACAIQKSDLPTDVCNTMSQAGKYYKNLVVLCPIHNKTILTTLRYWSTFPESLLHHVHTDEQYQWYILNSRGISDYAAYRLWWNNQKDYKNAKN